MDPLEFLANFRRAPIRSRHLLDSAKGEPCTLCIPGICNRDPATTVSCHVHDETFGMSEKADDCSTFHGCSACHRYLDTGAWLGKMSEADMLKLILRAIQRTMRNRILRGFMAVKLDKPPKPKAAKPRPPKAQRAKFGKGPPITNRSNWPKGRSLPPKKGTHNGPQPHPRDAR